jgi:hypothetical protein
LMGTPPSAPPPGVNTNLPVDNNGGGAVPATVRDMLEAHRSNPTCNGCHGVMDPLGNALENFDAIGTWRERDRFAGLPINADGKLAIGVPVDGPIALRNALVADKEQFVGTMTENLLSYALGRAVSHSDMPTVRTITRDASPDDYTFAALVRGVVLSKQFRYQKVPGEEALLGSISHTGNTSTDINNEQP